MRNVSPACQHARRIVASLVDRPSCSDWLARIRSASLVRMPRCVHLTIAARSSCFSPASGQRLCTTGARAVITDQPSKPGPRAESPCGRHPEATRGYKGYKPTRAIRATRATQTITPRQKMHPPVAVQHGVATECSSDPSEAAQSQRAPICLQEWRGDSGAVGLARSQSDRPRCVHHRPKEAMLSGPEPTVINYTWSQPSCRPRPAANEETQARAGGKEPPDLVLRGCCASTVMIQGRSEGVYMFDSLVGASLRPHWLWSDCQGTATLSQMLAARSGCPSYGDSEVENMAEIDVEDASVSYHAPK